MMGLISHCALCCSRLSLSVNRLLEDRRYGTYCIAMVADTG